MELNQDVQGILLDVEGTTTPISFVHDTLFPFARQRLEATCARAKDDAGILRAVGMLRSEHAAEPSDQVPEFGDGAPYAAFLMSQDRKSTGLKELQGIIWEDGYRNGQLRAPIFDDVLEAFEAWRQTGLRLRIFSSGSVLAQQLLFSHTDQGDITGLLEDYHDTTTGPKKVSESYNKIAAAFALPCPSILFLSDVVSELDAARTAGMRTGLLARPGNPEAPPHEHPTYSDFRPLF